MTTVGVLVCRAGLQEREMIWRGASWGGVRDTLRTEQGNWIGWGWHLA